MTRYTKTSCIATEQTSGRDSELTMMRSRSVWLETVEPAVGGGEGDGRSLDRRIRRPAFDAGGEGSAMFEMGGRACRLGEIYQGPVAPVGAAKAM
jgi:hypothetical protein